MISIQGKSHIAKRDTNEDRIVADSQWGIALVADGMGGPASGEIAAGIVASVLVDRLDAGIDLATSISDAHQKILKAVENGQGKRGMGSTVVAAHFNGNDYCLCWIGDSRAFLWNGELRQISRDHSQIETMLARGEIKYSDTARHPKKNLITRAMGHGSISVDSIPQVDSTLYQGQKLLLCSDGLHDMLSLCEIATIMSSGQPSAEIVDTLIHRALEKGGADNISVVIVDASDDAAAIGNKPLPEAVAIARADGFQQHFLPRSQTNKQQ